MENASVSIDIVDHVDEFFTPINSDEDDVQFKETRNCFPTATDNAIETRFLSSFKHELEKLPPLSSSGWSICKVPANLRTVKPDAYDPQFISIGPVHHEKDSLSTWEIYKRQYAKSLLYRTRNPLQTADDCAKGVLDLVDEVRSYYNVPLRRFNKGKLAKIMLVDGCFIVELLIRCSSINIDRAELQNDPIFTSSWILPALRRDLALLENQIPLLIPDFLLNSIKRRAKPSLPSHLTINELALNFFGAAIHVNAETIKVASRQSSVHLLHVIHNGYTSTTTKVPQVVEGPVDLMENATKLSKSGIEFKHKNSEGLLGLRFQNGVLEIPQLIIDDATESLFRNLIAFEQCCHPDPQYILSYMFLMSRLVNNIEDVELLEVDEIIKNNSRGNVDVPKFLSNICKQVVLENFYFAGLCSEVNFYFNKRWYRHCAGVNRHFHNRWHRYCAILRRDYFNSPWTTISFIAALFLLALTTLQTLYSVLSYYPH